MVSSTRSTGAPAREIAPVVPQITIIDLEDTENRVPQKTKSPIMKFLYKIQNQRQSRLRGNLISSRC